MDVAHDSRWYARRALVAYLVTIAITRGITTVLHLRGAGADGGVIIDGIHIHHMVFGLTILVILTFGELLILGARRAHGAAWAYLFGVAWALVLDEFALIIDLRDVYWAPAGDISIVALIAMGILLALATAVPLRRRA